MEPTAGFLFVQPLFALAFNILVVLYRLLGGNLGLAIIVFTIVLKAISLPFSIRQVESTKKNQEFQAKYKELQKKHKGDKDKLNKELATLQSEYLPAQIGGCLPTILQLVFFFQVYYVIFNILEKGSSIFNTVNYGFVAPFAQGEQINLWFLGMNLGQSASQVGFNDLKTVFPYLVLILLVGLSQWVSTKVMSGENILPGKKASKDKVNTDEKKKVQEDLGFGDAMQQASKQMLYILPVMTMFLSVSFPAGLSLYWTVTSGFAIIQQLIVNRKKKQNKI